MCIAVIIFADRGKQHLHNNDNL